MFRFVATFSRGRWALVLGICLLTSAVWAQRPLFRPVLRGPPIQTQPPAQTVTVPNPSGGTATTIQVPAKVQLMPGAPPVMPLDNGSLQPGFVYDILPPAASGGSSISGGLGGGGIGGG